MIKRISLIALLICTPTMYPSQPDEIFEYSFMTMEAPEFDTQSYDEFDSIADDMEKKGITPAVQKPPSRAIIFGRRIGSFLLMTYFATKSCCKNIWHSLKRKKGDSHAITR